MPLRGTAQRRIGAKNDGNAVDDYVGIVVLNLNGDTSKRSRFEKIQS